MSPRPFNHSPDLQQLRDEGYCVQVIGGLLLLREVPYVDAQKNLRVGTLISTLVLAGDATCAPDTHVVHWTGDFPCNADGNAIVGIAHAAGAFDLGHGVRATHSFSSKPEGGYPNYHAKMSSYASILSGPAAVLHPEATPRMFRRLEDEEQSMFTYADTSSSRAGVGALIERLTKERVAIVGLGGTGSYVLDLVSKTPVREIRMFDGDVYLQHNAFRSPGAPTLEQLRNVPKKVDHLRDIYSHMHRGIVGHTVALDTSNLQLLDGITFAFLCLDSGESKGPIIEKLEQLGAAFVDVGMGLELVDGSLGGILRVTASTSGKRDHLRQGRISFAGGGQDDVYTSNIQIADLNALNAALAVVKWKKIRGFYRDCEREHHFTYTTDGNVLINGDFQ